MKKYVIFAVGLLASLLLSTTVCAQWVDVQADEVGSMDGRPGWSAWKRNVIVKYGSIRVYGDYAESNPNTSEFEVRGNVRVRTQNGGIITGKTLRNYPREKLMIIDKDVVFRDKDSTKLFTDQLIYNRETEISTYKTGGKTITKDSTIMTSKIGHIHSKTNAFHGKTDVVIINPDYEIHTDTMQMLDNVINFYSATHIWSDSNYLYCEKGWYKSDEKIASFAENVFMQTPDNQLFADSIYYEMNIDFGKAFDNVVVIDTANDIVIFSDFAQSDRRIGDAWFTQNAVAVMVTDGDSLWLRGDTLRLAYDTNTNATRSMSAYYNVRFFRSDMQGASDSLAYVAADSTMTMFGNPIVWANGDQMTGDTIQVLLSENKPKNMYLLQHAFIIAKGLHNGHYNQIQGREVVGFFNDSSDLETIKVFENVETIYYVTDDIDSSLIGILKVKSDEMEMKLQNQEIENINYIKPQAGSMFPDAELPLEERFLKGFLWQIERCPKSKMDIFSSTNERSLPQLRLIPDTKENR